MYLCQKSGKMQNEIIREFHQLYKGQPLVVRAPGRINLIGEHTDYNDGFVLPAAIDRAVYFAIADSGSERCNITAKNMARSVRFFVSDPEPPIEDVWVKYLFGVVSILRERTGRVGGFNLVFQGNIPLGAGLSSSAALTCGFATALNELFDLGLSRREIARLGQQTEHEYAGVRTGIMDQFASTCGEAHHAMLLDCRSLRYDLIPASFGNYTLLLFDSMVKHALVESSYNDRRASCERGVALIAGQYPEVKALRDVNRELLSEFADELGYDTYVKCNFVVEENLRVRVAAEAMRAGDVEMLGSLLYDSHKGLSEAYQVTCRETDFLVEQTRNMEHVFGARQMGGGFGGCTINLVHQDHLEETALALEEAYHEKLGLAGRFYVVEITDGIQSFEPQVW